MKRLFMLFIALIMFIFNFSASAESSDSSETGISTQSVNAVWQEHDKKFFLHSIHNYYSCDGLESKVEIILEELGAKDVQAKVRGCYELHGQLGKSLRVKVKFKTLTTDTSVDGEAVVASFQNVHIKPRHPRSIKLGDCEVIEDIQDTLLSSFEHEVIKANRKCYPGSRSLGDVNWKLRVLKATS